MNQNQNKPGEDRPGQGGQQNQNPGQGGQQGGQDQNPGQQKQNPGQGGQQGGQGGRENPNR
jgi:hypothetical protein